MSLLRSPSTLRSFAVDVLLLAAAYLVVGNGLFFFVGSVQVAVVIGALAALRGGGPARAATLTFVAIGAASALAAPRFVGDAPAATVWMMLVLQCAVAAALFATLRARVHARGRFDVAIGVMLVALCLVNLWVPLLIGGVHPLVGYGPLPANAVRMVLIPGQYQTDDELYRRFFSLLHEGEGHYEAFKDAWLGLRVRGELPSTYFSYRLPTYYWLWRLLPNDAFTIELVFLSFASVGVVAAALIAAQLGGVVAGILAATGLATYSIGVAMSVYFVYVDFPAACLVLAAVALWIYARRIGSLPALRVAFLLLALAALSREILAYLMVLAFVATWFMPATLTRAARRAAAAAVAVTIAGYALHVAAVERWIPNRTGHLNYQQGSLAFALDAIATFGDVFHGTNVTLAALCLSGIVASAVGLRIGYARSVASRAATPAGDVYGFLCVGALLPLVAMVAVGNPGHIPGGGVVNYWGLWIVPLALTTWPLIWPRITHDV